MASATPTDKHFDLVVIGGGSGGSGCSRRAAGYGKKVCIIERGHYLDENGVRQGGGVGGTCVNVGCVPKKMMFIAAGPREMMSGHGAVAPSFGYENIGEMTFNWGVMKSKRDAYVKRLNNAYENNWSKAGITQVNGFAKLSKDAAGKTIVGVTDPKTGATVDCVTADHIVIATGGFPNLPSPLKENGGDLCITSDGFFDLEEQPKKCAVIGAGYIAVEMAGILNALGTETDLFCRGDTVLRRGFDPFIVSTLMAELAKHGPTVQTNRSPLSAKKESDGTLTLTVEYSHGDSKEIQEFKGYDCILVATGRDPATCGIGLEEVGVEVTKKGLITVDKYENTTVPGIYAIGDATITGWELTPVAIAAGRRLADRLFGGEPKARIDYDCIPTVVFSHPPIGVVGMTQEVAEGKYGASNITTKTALFGSMDYAFVEDQYKVKTGVKMVLAGEEEKVVGLHLIGPSADEILQGFGVAIRMGATRADFEQCVAIHPTSAEEIVTMGGWGQKGGRPHLPASLNE